MAGRRGGTDDNNDDDETTLSSRRITNLHSDDVLLGRGLGASQYVGNKQFLSVVEAHKESYTKTESYKAKALIAKQVFAEIQNRGGRFLKLVHSGGGAHTNNVVQDGIWRIANEKDALEKCKQALRQKREEKKKHKIGTTLDETTSSSSRSSSTAAAARDETKQQESSFILAEETVSSSDIILAPIMTTPISQQVAAASFDQPAAAPPWDSPGFSLLEGFDAEHIESLVFSPDDPIVDAAPTVAAANRTASSGVEEYPIEKQESYNSLQTSSGSSPAAATTDPTPAASSDGVVHHPALTEKQESYNSSQTTSASSSGSSWYNSSSSSDTETSLSLSMDQKFEFLSMKIVGHPIFSLEEAQVEKSKLTDAERADILSDLMGNLDIVGPTAKKPKQDTSQETLDQAVHEMRREIDEVSLTQKQAWSRAQTVCLLDEEFNDMHLLKFLQCEGMNAKLAAQRFVKYWECRRQVFGEELYTKRMTLNGALRNDWDAIEDGVLFFLPHLDSAGRQILYVEPHRRTRGKYSSESLLRSLWYSMEVACRRFDSVEKGFISVAWLHNATVWDYDHHAYTRIPYYQDTCFPIQQFAQHGCNPPLTSLKLIKPVLDAINTRKSRLRHLQHVVPKHELLGVLSEYGIMAQMLPTTMGGSIVLDMSTWMADRKRMEEEQAQPATKNNQGIETKNSGGPC